jgi:hypothetical protein
LQKGKEEDSLFEKEFGFVFPEDEDNDTVLGEAVETIYLWEEHLNLLDFYQIAQSYPINEFYSLNSQVLVSLIQEAGLSIRESLSNISSIHSGYLSVILPT